MKVVGLITEYNPFHNGHKYHIEEAKRLTGADYVIAVMSGNFVQRGTPAVIDKYSRTRMALDNGVDLVLELPVCYATGSAEFFAHGAVSLLHRLGIVNYICFGSESGDITLLQRAAQLLINTPEDFDNVIQAFLKDGMTYPAARLKALEHILEAQNIVDGKVLNAIFTEPNNILGIEYLKALNNLSSGMIPVTIKRKAAHYHDTALHHNNSSVVSSEINSLYKFTMSMQPVISSATAIRKTINNREHVTSSYLREIESSVPENVFTILSQQYLKIFPITEEDFSQIIKYKLLSEDRNTLASYVDISGDLADRLKNITDYNLTIAKLVEKIKTKNMTMTRIQRALIHLLLNIKSERFSEYNAYGYSTYARVLGIRKEASHLLRSAEKSGQLPIITKVSKAKEQLEPVGYRMFCEDLFATHLYNQAVYEKYKTRLENEYKHGIIIV